MTIAGRRVASPSSWRSSTAPLPVDSRYRDSRSCPGRNAAAVDQRSAAGPCRDVIRNGEIRWCLSGSSGLQIITGGTLQIAEPRPATAFALNVAGRERADDRRQRITRAARGDRRPRRTWRSRRVASPRQSLRVVLCRIGSWRRVASRLVGIVTAVPLRCRRWPSGRVGEQCSCAAAAALAHASVLPSSWLAAASAAWSAAFWSSVSIDASARNRTRSRRPRSEPVSDSATVGATAPSSFLHRLRTKRLIASSSSCAPAASRPTLPLPVRSAWPRPA